MTPSPVCEIISGANKPDHSSLSCGPNSEYPALGSETPEPGVEFITDILVLNAGLKTALINVISGMDGVATEGLEAASDNALAAEQEQEQEGEEKPQEPETATA